MNQTSIKLTFKNSFRKTFVKQIKILLQKKTALKQNLEFLRKIFRKTNRNSYWETE